MALHDKPVLIYDGNCGFCKIWIEYWKTLTADAIVYAASQNVGPRLPANSGGCVQQIRTTCQAFRGGSERSTCCLRDSRIQSLATVAFKLILQPSRFRPDHRNGISAGG